MGKRVVITDHARVRYAERVLGLNIDQMIIKDMRENEVNENANVLGSGLFPIKGKNVNFLVKKGRLITVMNDGMDYVAEHWRVLR